MARIPQSFIDGLLSRLDIVEVIGRRLALKRAGREFQARCPFHDERSASFSVSPQKQFYHCFGCGAHGTAVGFVMNYDNLEFTDAVEQLASEIGVEVPYEGGGYKREDGSDALFGVLSDATQFFIRQLQSNSTAKAYLEQRGVNQAMIERFQLGWAPSDGNLLAQALASNSERKKALELAGLTSNSGRGDYAKFRERVMFPILDKRGRTIAFGGRIIGAGEPKYLNSPETPLFKKSNELYGLYFARQQKASQLVVVEGYMDVLSLVQFGVTEAVATLGTATSREHAEILFRNVEDLVFCFDGDRAGRQAAWRALTNVLPRMRDGRQAHFLFLPDGEDPDSIVRKEGAEGFRKRCGEALTLSQYFFDELGKQADTSTLDGRARLAEKAKPLLETIPEGAFAELMQAELSKYTGLSKATASTTSKSFVSKQTSNFLTGANRNQELARGSLVRQAIILLLSDPSFASQADPPYPFAALDQPGISLLLTLIELARERPDVNGSMLIESFAGQEEHAALVRLLTAPLAGDSDSHRADFISAIRKLNERAATMRVQWLKERLLSGAVSEQEKAELRELLLRPAL